eukprot:PhM_4_TR7199/c0_g1_i1/m.86651
MSYYDSYSAQYQDGSVHMLFNGITLVAFYIAVLFMALSVACGLYYVGELAEEYSVRTRRILQSTLGVIALAYVLLPIIDGLSWWRCLLSALHQACYALLLRRFPWVSLSSPAFILSVYAFVMDHIVWYSYFLSDEFRYEYNRIVGFFFLMVWAVPFTLFVTLNVEEQYLPGTSSTQAHSGGGGSALGGEKRRRGFLRSIFSFVRTDKGM